MRITSVTVGYGQTVTTPGYGAARIYREYTASVKPSEKAADVEAQLELLALESVSLVLAASPWEVVAEESKASPDEEARPRRRAVSTFDPELVEVA